MGWRLERLVSDEEWSGEVSPATSENVEESSEKRAP